MITLRPYQSVCIDRLRAAIRAGERRILLVLPTGAGKGTMATFMIQGALARGKRILFLVNRRTLVNDLSKRLDRLGLDHGIIMGNHPRRKPWLTVHVASIDTLHRRTTVPPADLLFLDEAHFSISEIWSKVIERYAGVPLIGMTATPIRTSGEGLGRLYDVLIEGPSVAELTELGHLVPTRVFAPNRPDLSKVHVQAGEYNPKEVAAVMDKARLTGDIVAHWLRHGKGRPTVAFACNVQHSRNIVQEFQQAGVRAEHVDAQTPDDVRDRLWEYLAEYRVQVISSVGVISYGWDVPPVSCGILARPTASLGLHLQQCGRVLRSAPGKADALILDHAGNTLKHGFVEDPREWDLEDGLSLRRRGARDTVESIRTCRACWFTFRSSEQACPSCGTPYTSPLRMPEQEAGELQEIARQRKQQAIDAWRAKQDDTARRRKFDEFIQVARERGYKPGYVLAKFKAVFCQEPPRPWVSEMWARFRETEGKAVNS